MVGDREGVDNRGMAAVYDFSAGNWGSGVALARPSGAFDFGWALALSQDGNRAFVADMTAGGMPGFGAVHVYQFSVGSWGPGIALPLPGTETNFGWSVAPSADGNVVAVGDTNGNATGQVWIYRSISNTWNPPVELLRPAVTQNFGRSLAMSGAGNRVVVGDYDGNLGHAYVYTYD